MIDGIPYTSQGSKLKASGSDKKPTNVDQPRIKSVHVIDIDGIEFVVDPRKRKLVRKGTSILLFNRLLISYRYEY